MPSATYQLRVTAPAPARLTALGADGVSVTDRYVAVEGAPVFPVTGEVHFSRLPRAQWDATLHALRAGGATHVATYVLWNHHEQARGEASFEGGLDLGAFLSLAAEHGLGIVLRIGPYAHAEARHGGLPDWIAEGGFAVRTDDPAYLAEVERWYAMLAEQTRGIELFAIQVDNELYDQPQHLSTLRTIAERVGFSAPLWVATGWGGADLPDDVLPVFGGYSDSFWIEASDLRDHRSESNFYPSPRRDDDSIGADHRAGVAGEAREYDLPFATCELGSGMTAAYHRRPVVTAADVEGLALAKLASGSVWQGYYMFSDGRNPRAGLQESHAAGEPNDFPDISYDFGAPLAADARPRDSWYRLRRQHQLLETWGPALAAMPATFPRDAPDAPDETGLRWSVRSDGTSGFVFVVNHQPGVALPPHDDVAFRIETDAGEVAFPAVDIPSGAAFIWPFGLRVGDATIEWVTAQPLTEVVWRGAPLVVLSATAGVPVEFSADAESVPVLWDGPGRMRELRLDDTVRARMLILEESDGLRLAVVDGQILLTAGVAGGGRVVLHPGASGGAGGAAAAEVRSASGAAEVSGPEASAALGGSSVSAEVLGDAGPAEVLRLADAGWERLEVPAVPDAQPVSVTLVQGAGQPPSPSTAGNGRASIPVDWSSAARFDLDLPEDSSATLVIEWEGDAARAWVGERLLSDALYRGEPWRIGPHERDAARHITIEVLPLHPDAPVLIGGGRRRPQRAAVTAARLERAVTVRLD